MGCGCGNKTKPATPSVQIASLLASGAIHRYEARKLKWLARQPKPFDFEAWTELKKAFVHRVWAYLEGRVAAGLELSATEELFLELRRAYLDLIDCKAYICDRRKQRHYRLVHDMWIQAYPGRGDQWLRRNTI